MSANQQMDKQIVVYYTAPAPPPTKKTEGTTEKKPNNLDESQRHLISIKLRKETNIQRNILYDRISHIKHSWSDKSTEMEKRLVVAKE